MTAMQLCGGEFPPDFEASSIDANQWGTIEIEFDSTATAQILWQSNLSQYSSGSATLQRLTELAGRAMTSKCQKFATKKLVLYFKASI